MRFLHTADIHADKNRKTDIVKLIDQYILEVKSRDIDAVLIAGDFWHHAVVNNTPFAQIIEKMSELIKLVPVYMIYGTPHHEIAQSLELFRLMGAKVADKPTLWTFEKNSEKIDILGIPEPRRNEFVGKDNKDTPEKIRKHLEQALRIQHDNPLIIMWHGEVTGAKYQNGKDAVSDIRLSPKMVEDIKPLYVACGHIHTPQDIDVFHYCGSPVPIDFGELHKPSYNLIEVNDGKVTFEKVSLPFPQNRVIDCESTSFTAISKMNFKGLNVKINLTLTPEEQKLFKFSDTYKQVLADTKAEKIKLSIKTVPTSVVRSKEIVKTTNLIEKLKIYGNLNNIKISPEVISKAEDIQNNMLIKYNFPSHSFELISLSLRGAKGIKGKEEIFIDFSKYDDGILALIGPNGSGKSTLIEFASPYPRLLTRTGALRTHFYLKDSHRIIIYKDESGRLYKLSTHLAAHVESGLVRYYAATSDDNGETWQEVKDCDGNLVTYQTYVEETFGSLSVYLRTAFFTRGKVKGISDIASATKGERIELLSQLFGTDNLSTMHDMVKERIKDVEKAIELCSGAEQQKSELEKQIERQSANKELYSKDLEETEVNLKEIEDSIKKTRVQEEEFNAHYAKSGNLIQAKADNENRYIELKEHLDKLENHKKQNDFYRLNKNAIEEYKQTYKDSLPVSEELSKLGNKYREQTNLVLELTKTEQETKSRYETEDRKYSSADERIRSAKNNQIEIYDTCPTCGAKLSERKKKELLKAQEYVNSEIEALVAWKDQQKIIVAEAKKKHTEAKNKLTAAEKKLKELKTTFDEKDGAYQATKAYLDINDKYMPYIDYLKVDNLESDIERIKTDMKRIEDFLESVSGIDMIDFKAKLEELEAERKEAEEARLRLSVDIATISSSLEQAKEALKLADEKVTEAKEKQKDLSDYLVLEKAFANSGIQALEIEAAIPEIAALTNSILQSSYGDKFQVTFSTLRQGKTKIVDDFCIDVLNIETGWTVPIELLSAGEKIWVIQSLYFAFSIIRMQKTGFNFVVRFIDESDGELDSEKRLEYVRMIKSVHESGHNRLTVLVTHSQELKDIIPQSIQM